MSESVHRDPLSAWKYLIQHGGIELDGRDEGLDERILQRLDPAAPSFVDALVESTMAAFTRAFFEAIHPFLSMFHDILSFFEHADATKGPAQWILQVDDIPLELSHFQEWIERWRNTGVAEMHIPALDSRGIWRLWDLFRDKEQIAAEIQRSFRQERLRLPHDVQTWVDAYNRGEYLVLPASLLSPVCPLEVRSSASIAQAALTLLREKRMTREKLRDLHRRHKGEMDRSDGLDFWSIANHETDIWLRSFVVALSAAASHLSESEIASLGGEIGTLLSEFPLRPFNVEVSVEELESVLSLPIWRKRYELYSVWVATEMVRALGGHQIELHHDNGRIVFAFHETLVATIHSSPGPFRIISERRRPLLNPQGKGRSTAVQPDHGLWTTECGEEVCRLVVEVKHYKKTGKRVFLDVFEDYARAFPGGDIYLVNYGPTGSAVYDVSRSIRDQCHAIAHLTPMGVEARKEFALAIRKCVGEPIAPWPETSGNAVDTALAIDVSASMETVLHSNDMATLVRHILVAEHPSELIAVNTSVVGTWPPNEKGLARLIKVSGGSTALRDPIRDLLNRFARIVVITDQDGMETLSRMQMVTHPCDEGAPEGVHVRVCTRTLSYGTSESG